MLGSGGDLCYFGPAADDMARSLPSTPKAVEGLIRGFGAAGADEVICWPTIAELDRWIAAALCTPCANVPTLTVSAVK